MEFQSRIKQDDLQTLNAKVKERGYVDREHLTELLTLIPTNDSQHIVQEVKTWLQALHDDPAFERVQFPGDDINAIISDLDSYGRVQAETLLKFKQENARTVPAS